MSLPKIGIATAALMILASPSLADFCTLKVWDDAGMSGQKGSFYATQMNMADLRYWPTNKYPLGRVPNDTFSSIEVVSGVWKICYHSGLRECGDEYKVGATVPNFHGTPWQDSISSVQLVKCDASVGAQPGNYPKDNCTVDGTSFLPNRDDDWAQKINNGSCSWKIFD